MTHPNVLQNALSELNSQLTDAKTRLASQEAETKSANSKLQISLSKTENLKTSFAAKKKTWEVLDRLVPTHVMEIPQMKRERDRVLWLEEVKDFKKKMEEVSGKTISSADITKATVVMNEKRKALQRLNALRAHAPAPISGKDALLIEQIAAQPYQRIWVRGHTDTDPVKRPETVQRFPHGLKAAFSGSAERRLSFRIRIPAAGTYHVILDNRKGDALREVKVYVEALPARRPEKRPAPPRPKPPGETAT